MNLNELVLNHKGARSYDDLERECGGVLSSQRLQQIATAPPKQFPKAETIRVLAKLLGVKESVVVLAVAESLGLDVRLELPKLLQVLPTAASDLSDDEAAAIAHVIRAFKSEGGGVRVHRTAPNKPPAGRPGAQQEKYVIPDSIAARGNLGNLSPEDLDGLQAAIDQARNENAGSLHADDDSTRAGETPRESGESA